MTKEAKEKTGDVRLTKEDLKNIDYIDVECQTYINTTSCSTQTTEHVRKRLRSEGDSEDLEPFKIYETAEEQPPKKTKIKKEVETIDIHDEEDNEEQDDGKD